MSLMSIPIPDQFEGKKTFRVDLTLEAKSSALVNANTEDEAWDKATQLAKLQELEFDDIEDVVDIEVDDIQEE